MCRFCSHVRCRHEPVLADLALHTQIPLIDRWRLGVRLLRRKGPETANKRGIGIPDCRERVSALNRPPWIGKTERSGRLYCVSEWRRRCGHGHELLIWKIVRHAERCPDGSRTIAAWIEREADPRGELIKSRLDSTIILESGISRICETHRRPLVH